MWWLHVTVGPTVLTLPAYLCGLCGCVHLSVPLQGAFINLNRSSVTSFDIQPPKGYLFPEGLASCMGAIQGRRDKGQHNSKCQLPHRSPFLGGFSAEICFDQGLMRCIIVHMHPSYQSSIGLVSFCQACRANNRICWCTQLSVHPETALHAQRCR